MSETSSPADTASTPPVRDRCTEFGPVPLERLRAGFRASTSPMLRELAEASTPSLVDALRTLAGLKRLFERSCGDTEFRDRFCAGAVIDDGTIPPIGLEDVDCLRDALQQSGEDRTPVSLTGNLSLLWDFMREGNDWRTLELRANESHDGPYLAWRRRRKELQRFELPAGVETWFRPAGALELTLGCSVGCWFCGISAPRPGGVFRHEENNAREFRQIIEVLRRQIGPAAATSLCYWATDPFDNPDYEQFIEAFHETLGLCPTTLTALPLKDPRRTRRMLALSARLGCISNQFSILSKPLLRQLHSEFSAEELLCVPLALQLKGAHAPTGNFPRTIPIRKVNAGRARRPKGAKPVTAIDSASGSIACVIGFLLNLVERSVRLIAPCAATDVWPNGYVVFETASYEDPAELDLLLAGMIERHMPLAPPLDRSVRFQRCLDYRADLSGFELSTHRHRVAFRSSGSIPGLPDWWSLGELIRAGSYIPADLERIFAARHVAPQVTHSYLQMLFDAGVLDDEPAPSVHSDAPGSVSNSIVPAE